MSLALSSRIESRSQILARFKAKVAEGRPIIGSGAGIGISAKAEEVGGTDLIICYNSGEFRMQGRTSSSGHRPLGNAHEVVLKLGQDILPVVDHTPVLAGVFAGDSYRFMDKFLTQLKEMGFAGIQNFPCQAHIPGSEELFGRWDLAGYSNENEAECVHIAHELDMLTTPYIFTVEHAKAMTKAGADLLVVHCGGTGGGLIGFKTLGYEVSLERCRVLHDVVKDINPDAMVIAHGGPWSRPVDLQYLFDHSEDIVGFYGASSCERICSEERIVETVRGFANCTLS